MIKIEKSFYWVVLALGFTSISTQILLLREFLSIFYGNELVVGIVLSNWMILIGIGSYLGRISFLKNIQNIILALLILLAVVPLISVFLLNYLRNVIFDVGVQLDILEIFFYSFLILLPFCLISGFGFTFLSKIVSEKYSTNLISRIYAVESIGSIIAGMLMSFLLSFYLSNIQILILLFLLNLSIALIVSFRSSHFFFRLFTIILASFVVLSNYFLNYDIILKQLLYDNHKIEYCKNTPYGSLVITETYGQKNVYENSLLLFSTNDPISNEEAVHYAMLQHPNPENVLLISGGVSGTVEEILKYSVKSVDYVELNPFIIRLIQRFYDHNLSDKVNYIALDARLFINEIEKKYDVVLTNLPEPSTAQINRYYTDEFLKKLKQKLNPNAVVSFSLSSSMDYLSYEARKFKSVFYNTLKNNFQNVIIIPGYKDFFICSDGALNLNIPELVDLKGIQNSYVNKFYLDFESLKLRSKFILEKLVETDVINTDFNPVIYYHQIVFWLSQFEIDYHYIMIILAVVLFILILRLDYISYGMFAGGFAASGNGFLLIIAFQIIYGYVYQMIGIIIAVFMLGLAIGAITQKKIFKNVKNLNYALIQFCIFLLSALIPVALVLMNQVILNSALIIIFLLLLAFLIGFVVGLEFALAVNLKKGKYEKIASEIYSIDMIGSAAGSLIIAIFLLPLLGFIYSGFIIGGMNLVGSMLTVIKRD